MYYLSINNFTLIRLDLSSCWHIFDARYEIHCSCIVNFLTELINTT